MASTENAGQGTATSVGGATTPSLYTTTSMNDKGESLHSEAAKGGPASRAQAGNRLAAVQEHDDDVARKIFAAHAEESEWTAAEEKKTVRKIDILLLPIMMFTIGLQLTDKGIYGAACTNGMCPALGLYETQVLEDGTTINNTSRYSFASMIFYVGYICGIYPLAWICQKLPTAKATSAYTVIWGLIVILQVVCTNYQGAYAQRFFLGFMESGISPAFALITSMFYTKREQAFRLPLWYAGGFFILANSQFVTWAFSNITNGSIAAWKAIFIFWGALTMAWGVFAWYILPSSQEKALWLTERERYISIARLRADQDSVKSKHLKLDQLKELAIDPRAWCVMIVTFCILPPNGLTGTFIPVVVQGLGFSKHDSILLTAPAHYVSTISGWLLGFLCLKITNFRVIGIAICLIPCLIGDVMLWQIDRSNTAACLAAIFMNSSFAGALTQVQALVPSNTAGTTKKLFFSASTYLAYCLGNIAGPLFLKGSEAPYYPSAFKANTVILCLAYLFLGIYYFLCRRENKKRDAMGDEGRVDHAFEDLTDVQNKAFRYKL